MKGIVIFDLDGTLADIKHRLHFIQGTNKDKDWEGFYKACVDDTPIKEVIELTQMFRVAGFKVHVWSGRSDVVLNETINWLIDNQVRFDALKMRKEGDLTPDVKLKGFWLEKFGKEGIFMVFDDRDRLVKMWRDNGVKCLQCAEGNF